jgi:hypothetical protein
VPDGNQSDKQLLSANTEPSDTTMAMDSSPPTRVGRKAKGKGKVKIKPHPRDTTMEIDSYPTTRAGQKAKATAKMKAELDARVHRANTKANSKAKAKANTQAELKTQAESSNTTNVTTTSSPGPTRKHLKRGREADDEGKREREAEDSESGEVRSDPPAPTAGQSRRSTKRRCTFPSDALRMKELSSDHRARLAATNPSLVPELTAPLRVDGPLVVVARKPRHQREEHFFELMMKNGFEIVLQERVPMPMVHENEGEMMHEEVDWTDLTKDGPVAEGKLPGMGEIMREIENVEREDKRGVDVVVYRYAPPS